MAMPRPEPLTKSLRVRFFIILCSPNERHTVF
jgi:hypothetical protein